MAFHNRYVTHDYNHLCPDCCKRWAVGPIVSMDIEMVQCERCALPKEKKIGFVARIRWRKVAANV